MYLSQWKRIPRTFDRGSFTFSGRADITQPVEELLEPEDIEYIKQDLKNFIQQKLRLQKQGADYIQVYENKKEGLRIIIEDFHSQDQLQEMRDSGMPEDEVQAMNEHRWILDI